MSIKRPKKRRKQRERDDAKYLAQIRRDTQAVERKVKQAEALRALEAKIEARLRREMNLKSGFQVEIMTRTLEPMEEV